MLRKSLYPRGQPTLLRLGVAVALGVILATMPLLRRVTDRRAARFEWDAPAGRVAVASRKEMRGVATMHDRGDHDLPSWDAEGGGDPEEDPADELEAAIEQADRPFGSESFGVTSEEEEEGESLDQRLAQERPDRAGRASYVAIEDEGEGDEELAGEASSESDAFVAPEDAAVTIRRQAPGAVDHPPDPAVEEE